MDETTRPGDEPTRVNGNGTVGGVGAPHPTGWQLAGENGSRMEPNSPRPGSSGSRLDSQAVPPEASPQDGFSTVYLRTAEANWSAAGAALESTGSFGAHWRSPVANGQRGRAGLYPRTDPSPQYAELLAPISPPVVASASAPPYPYEGDLEQTTGAPGTPQASYGSPAATGFPPYPLGSPPPAGWTEAAPNLSVLNAPTLDDLPAIGQAAAASRAAARA
ncbi:MAG: hypothetical protein J2P15_19585, partial [Micromonosporaceae bacterium]|nr:hypothetical protein [Micromonosporaceae bacterium]